MSDVPNNSWPITEDSPLALADYAALIGIDPAIEWQMESSEQLALLALVQNIRPVCTIEIGTRFGGSLQLFSRYCQRVITCDIDPTCKERLAAQYPNVEFVVGPSQQTMPGVLERLHRDKVPLSLILIDGDHSAAGVQGDIHTLLTYRPICPLYVVMHDSFNPEVREGIRTARWADSPYVHSVELDFISGVLHEGGRASREMWGGFALAVFRPEHRTTPLKISTRRDFLFRNVLRRSKHWFLDPPTLTKRAARKLGRMVGIKV